MAAARERNGGAVRRVDTDDDDCDEDEVRRVEFEIPRVLCIAPSPRDPVPAAPWAGDYVHTPGSGGDDGTSSRSGSPRAVVWLCGDYQLTLCAGDWVIEERGTHPLHPHTPTPLYRGRSPRSDAWGIVQTRWQRRGSGGGWIDTVLHITLPVASGTVDYETEGTNTVTDLSPQAYKARDVNRRPYAIGADADADPFGPRCESIRFHGGGGDEQSRSDDSSEGGRQGAGDGGVRYDPFESVSDAGADSDTATTLSGRAEADAEGHDAPALTQVREQVNLAMEDPTSSNTAAAVAALSLTMIIASTVTLIVETIPKYQAESRAGDGPWFALETVFVSFFLAELLVRAWAAPHRLLFFTQVLNIVDVVAILPYFVELTVGDSGTGGNSAAGLRVLRVIRVVRVVRLLKIARYAEGIKLVIVVMAKVGDVLVLVMFVISIALLVWSSCIFYIEAASISDFENDTWTRENIYTVDGRHEWSPFQSIYMAFWWCISTITVVGYGDNVPYAPASKFIAAVAMISATFIIAIPASVFGSTFLTEYQQRNEQKERDRLATERARSEKIISILDYLISHSDKRPGHDGAASPRPALVSPCSPSSGASSRAEEVPTQLVELVLWDDSFATEAIALARARPALDPAFLDELSALAAGWSGARASREGRKARHGRYGIGAPGFDQLFAFQGGTLMAEFADTGAPVLRSAPTMHVMAMNNAHATPPGPGQSTPGNAAGIPDDRPRPPEKTLSSMRRMSRSGSALSNTPMTGRTSSRRLTRLGSISNDASHLSQVTTHSQDMRSRSNSVSFGVVPLGRAIGSNAVAVPSPRKPDPPLVRTGHFSIRPESLASSPTSEQEKKKISSPWRPCADDDEIRASSNASNSTAPMTYDDQRLSFDAPFIDPTVSISGDRTMSATPYLAPPSPMTVTTGTLPMPNDAEVDGTPSLLVSRSPTLNAPSPLPHPSPLTSMSGTAAADPEP